MTVLIVIILIDVITLSVRLCQPFASERVTVGGREVVGIIRSVGCDHLLAEQRLMLSPGAQFGGNGRYFVRINAATQRERVDEGMRRLTAGLRSFR